MVGQVCSGPLLPAARGSRASFLNLFQASVAVVAMARPGRLLLAAAALLFALRCCFVPSPSESPRAKSDFNPAVAASAALPALTMLAQDAEAKYGDQRKFAAVLVPLTTLVFPAVAMGMFVLYSFQEDAFWRIVPGTKRARELDEAWREHPLFANSKDPLDGLINPDDYDARADSDTALFFSD